MSSLTTDPHDGATRVTALPPDTVVIPMAQTSLATWWRRAQDRVVVAGAQKLRIGQSLHEAVEPIANEATAPYICAELLPPELLHLATFCGTQAFARLHPHLDFKPFPGDVARAYSHEHRRIAPSWANWFQQRACGTRDFSPQPGGFRFQPHPFGLWLWDRSKVL